jgi:uncharacterized membrane protein YeaQ/YmgE (transglycosylase-associated protein family)
MSIIGWIVLGLVAGFIASKVVNKEGEGLLLGIVGAVVGGFLFNQLGAAGVTASTSTACSWRWSAPSSCWSSTIS